MGASTQWRDLLGECSLAKAVQRRLAGAGRLSEGWLALSAVLGCCEAVWTWLGGGRACTACARLRALWLVLSGGSDRLILVVQRTCTALGRLQDAASGCTQQCEGPALLVLVFWGRSCTLQSGSQSDADPRLR